jgi:threonine dehydrogenase-like Zn-dependent dehydrogenase
MLAVAVISPGRIEIVDIPKPSPGPYEAVVKNAAAYICNATDRKLVAGHFPGIGPEKYPLLLGHESVGTVVEVGGKVKSFTPGDRVIGALLLAPTSSRYSSGWGQHGGLDMHVRVDESRREVYAGFSDFQLKKGNSILIFGAGPVGLSFCRMAKLLGLGWVGVADPIAQKREKAAALGADETFTPDSPELKDLTRRRGVPLDAIIDAVGSERIINAGLPLIRMAGSLCVYGVVGSPSITVAKDTGPYNFNLFVHQWPTRVTEAAAQTPLIEWIRAGMLSHGDFLTAEYPIREAAKAMKATEEPGSIKTLLRF